MTKKALIYLSAFCIEQIDLFLCKNSLKRAHFGNGEGILCLGGYGFPIRCPFNKLVAGLWRCFQFAGFAVIVFIGARYCAVDAAIYRRFYVVAGRAADGFEWDIQLFGIGLRDRVFATPDGDRG
jgi:hypothetical protein